MTKPKLHSSDLLGAISAALSDNPFSAEIVLGPIVIRREEARAVERVLLRLKIAARA